jgi:hypothetical protein
VGFVGATSCQHARGNRHASGKIADRLNGKPQTALKEQYSALEEARADLVALYFMLDPKLEELGLVSAADHHESRSRNTRRKPATCSFSCAVSARARR